MRIGIVSDLHCNADALQLALDRMGEVDELLCAGDSVQEYRFSNDVIELLESRKARCVLGNHDIGLLSASGERARGAAHVRAENVRWLAAQPLSIEVTVCGKKLLMYHASPLAPHTQYVYPRSPDLEALRSVDADFIVLGHTHTQMVQRVGRALVVNPGSTGEGRDPRNDRRLSYAVLDAATDEVVIDNFRVGDEAVPAFATSTQ